MALSRKLEVEVIGDVSNLQKNFDKAGRSTQTFGTRLGGMAKMAGIAGGAAALGAVVVGLKSTIGAAKDAEAAQARLESALGSANISFAKHGDAIDSAIQKTSQLAALDDEALSDSFSKLVRTSGNVKQSLEGMSLAADIARARNISLEAATKMVEKANLGSEAAFKRVGLAVEKGATSTEILAAAQEKFGGAAEKYGNTAAAAQERLGVSIENLQESIGQKLLPVFNQFLTKLNEAVLWVNANWPQIEADFKEGMDAAEKIFGRAKQIIEPLMRELIAIVKFIDALVHGEWSEAWEQLKLVVVNALKAVWEYLKLWKDTIGRAALALGVAIKDGVIDGVKALPGLLLDALEGYVKLVIGMYGKMASAAMGLGKSVVSGLASGLAGAAGAVASGVSSAVRVALNYLIDRINSALSFTIHVPFGPDISVDAPDIPHLATGARSFAGGLAVLGERGPELAVLPGGTNVIPNSRLGMATAGGPTINIYAGSVIHENDLVDVIQRAVGRYTRSNGSAPF